MASPAPRPPRDLSPLAPIERTASPSAASTPSVAAAAVCSPWRSSSATVASDAYTLVDSDIELPAAHDHPVHALPSSSSSSPPPPLPHAALRKGRAAAMAASAVACKPVPDATASRDLASPNIKSLPALPSKVSALTDAEAEHDGADGGLSDTSAVDAAPSAASAPGRPPCPTHAALRRIRHWVFGYGSLIHPLSREYTLRTPPLPEAAGVPHLPSVPATVALPHPGTPDLDDATVTTTSVTTREMTTTATATATARPARGHGVAVATASLRTVQTTTQQIMGGIVRRWNYNCRNHYTAVGVTEAQSSLVSTSSIDVTTETETKTTTHAAPSASSSAPDSNFYRHSRGVSGVLIPLWDADTFVPSSPLADAAAGLDLDVAATRAAAQDAAAAAAPTTLTTTADNAASASIPAQMARLDAREAAYCRRAVRHACIAPIPVTDCPGFARAAPSLDLQHVLHPDAVVWTYVCSADAGRRGAGRATLNGSTGCDDDEAQGIFVPQPLPPHQDIPHRFYPNVTLPPPPSAAAAAAVTATATATATAAAAAAAAAATASLPSPAASAHAATYAADAARSSDAVLQTPRPCYSRGVTTPPPPTSATSPSMNVAALPPAVQAALVPETGAHSPTPRCPIPQSYIDAILIGCLVGGNRLPLDKDSLPQRAAFPTAAAYTAAVGAALRPRLNTTFARRFIRETCGWVVSSTEVNWIDDRLAPPGVRRMACLRVPITRSCAAAASPSAPPSDAAAAEMDAENATIETAMRIIIDEILRQELPFAFSRRRPWDAAHDALAPSAPCPASTA
ncbi:hypothetical protein CXG81DRAFT_25258 [Caulochytrium protostelioides]|uniref:Uncharacterized protein n=1 Tax=Caulochytrium protostelioides TaxID=1555241 RepID=A0A4P9X9W7_9FUNG|nr:hypothetical protein CXG81DRAFT_25258 [Caulochytrium protostelioides]|eukprot:RKP02102.1 hypothetical protein CXG81DRAFT_25258 [Caulochytrium protostelioides]